MAVARRPQAAAGTLVRVLDGDYETWQFNDLLRVVAGHPNADRGVLLRVLHHVVRLLEAAEVRPYVAALALAGRHELTEAEVLRLAALPGSSRRLRRRLRTVVAGRGGQLLPGTVTHLMPQL
ncbi:hypothetical protein AB0J72_21620 [Dactylosporangium sp. NPDC049742]|uniref:hypothetical protein n=1 Tax=Dactylosporangium sp. NPDC049742 TaxID=3154737 RepID=UPI00342CE689